ncbi:peptidylprolyl isomerase [Hoyosella subflava]|uniref:Peptidyl-prolyl cis-trans isomerase n=1 Tax=Hoyosella subflava (strain DSM 45089 / JCM 17490 / NBRC 109087 / DQS3-9A1) TaxID=443218 RepID=F6ELM3_HOYSD|nr:peptidylprolyl isomerase [Hoyosella subflava]AEF40273.1 Peptidyl-prolyl cis-trans isomerase [Hoyosella subflava DQS3-9A1]
MSSNQERREAAKQKLERQLKERAEHDRRRKQLTIAAAVGGVVLVVGAAVAVFAVTRGDDTDVAAEDEITNITDEQDPFEAPEPEPLPEARSEALPPTVDCDYAESPMEAAREAELPPTSDVPTEGTVDVTLEMSGGPVTLTLDRAKSPCTVNSFVSLAEQGYYNDTECHRLTTGGIFVLQCGDPSASGAGGPGYSFADEFPADQYESPEEIMYAQTVYARGTVAMANAGPGTNGSQFFLVYDESPLPPAYNVFGTIDDEGLRVIDEVAEGGAPGNDGPPNNPADIATVTVRG